MSLLIKSLGFILIAAAASVMLKKQGSEYSFLITVFAVSAAGIYAIICISEPIDELKNIIGYEASGLKYISVCIKALLIAYLAGTVADTCRDNGQTALASKAELAGKCVIFMMTVPLFKGVIEVVMKFSNL